MHIRVINDPRRIDEQNREAIEANSECFECFEACYYCEPDGTCMVGISQICPRYPPLQNL